MRKADRQRHKFGSLIDSIADHESLIAGATGIDTLRDIGRLSADCVQYAAGLMIETILGIGITDILEDVPYQITDIDISDSGNFPSYNDQSDSNKCLTDYATLGILPEDIIQHDIRDLITDLIGMSLRNRFRSE